MNLLPNHFASHFKMSKAVSEEYNSSLIDLNFNSKPHINMLTMLAEENAKFAPAIVDTILTHVKMVRPELKLAALYLVDSILKNIGGNYIPLFSLHMISLFSSVFEKVGDTTRNTLYKLRQTWNDILPKNVLYGLDRTVNTIDPAWPISAMVSTPLSIATAAPKVSIHVNPKFLAKTNTSLQVTKQIDTEIEMRKQREMPNQVEAMQLKAFEEKKGEVVARQMTFPALGVPPVPVVHHQHIQESVLNHRDPRLRKLMAISQTTEETDKPGSTSFQALAVANSRLQMDSSILNNKANLTAISTVEHLHGKSSVLASNTFDACAPPSNVHKSATNTDEPRDITKDKHNTSRESLSRYCKINKKHSTSPENKLGANAKRFCKNPAEKPKRLHEGNLEFKENKAPPSKRCMSEITRMNNHTADLQGFEERLPESVCFGTVNTECKPKLRAETMLHSNHWPSSKPVNIHLPKSIERPISPSTTSIVLDGRSRTIHFVNGRALTIMDNNEPREVAFVGPPRNVYVEGMAHPLLLDFDGRQMEFLTEGRCNILRFGAPSREIYINNYPYEAKFGGPCITVILADQKEHRIRIDGPPPQVIISQKPAYELYEQFKRNNILHMQIPKKEVNDATLLQDVDMRVKPSCVQTTILPECKKDADWRQVASASDPSRVRNIPQISFGTYTKYDVPGARNYTLEASNVSSQLNYPVSSNPKVTKSEHFLPERNPNQSTWPHAAHREVANQPPLHQLHPMAQKPNHLSPDTTWDQMQSLPLPPSIPLSLNTSTASLPISRSPLPFSMPNLSVPPPSWKPFPSPPICTRAVPDAISTASVGSNSSPVFETTASLPSLPINVETIYEKLVAVGLISKRSLAEVANKEEKKEEKKSEQKNVVIPNIELTAGCLRQFKPTVIDLLYPDNTTDLCAQCETCGMRFRKNESEQYSQHLDWHIKIKRRLKPDSKYGYVRLLYPTIEDWIQYKGTGEEEERLSGFCELLPKGGRPENVEKEKTESFFASSCESENCSKNLEENITVFMKEEPDESISAAEAKMEALRVEPVKEENLKDQAQSKTDKSETPSIELLIQSKVEVSSRKDSTKEKGLNLVIKLKDAPIETKRIKEARLETSSKVLVPKVIDTNLSSDVETESTQEVKICPTNPDPKFKVLPPVLKGKELSALCTIM